jgi:hypothetical protein
VDDNVKENVMVTEEPAVASLAEEVEAARAALVEIAGSEPDRWWTARELRDRCQNGWAPAAVMIALNRLVAEGRFERDGRFRVRLLSQAHVRSVT